jgi:hypothetical protein
MTASSGEYRGLSWDVKLVRNPEIKQLPAHIFPNSTRPSFWKSTKMQKFLSLLATAALLVGTANSQFRHSPRNAPGPDADGKYTISAKGIRAQYVPYGASISNLFVNDTNGIERDIVLGWDNATYYTVDTSHPHLGGVPGVYSTDTLNMNSGC